MRNWVRYSLAGSAIVIGVLMLLIVLGATRRAHARVSCERIEVRFEDEHRFFSEDDIRTFLDKRYGVYTGQPLDSVDLGRIEQLLEGRSAIRSCEAWTTDDGVLHLSILQRSTYPFRELLQLRERSCRLWLLRYPLQLPFRPDPQEKSLLLRGGLSLRPELPL